MPISKAEEELNRFLDSQPAWRRKCLLFDYASATTEDLYNWCQRKSSEEWAITAEYERLLQRVPKAWKAYRMKIAEMSIQHLPKAPRGRPRKDDEAEEAASLKNSGKSWTAVGKKQGKSKDAVRKLVKSRQRRTVEKNTL